MKTYISILTAVAVLLMSFSCTKFEQTSLDEESLPLKVTVTGHVRYIAMDDTGMPEDPEIVESGTPVNIMFGIPDASGNTEFAIITVETDSDGFFEYQIGCPVGKTLTVKVNSSILGDSYTFDSDGNSVSSEAYFFAEIEKPVPGGKTEHFALDLVPSAYISEGGLIQP